MIDCIPSGLSTYFKYFSKISCLLGDNFYHLKCGDLYVPFAISKDEYKRRFRWLKDYNFIGNKGG